MKLRIVVVIFLLLGMDASCGIYGWVYPTFAQGQSCQPRLIGWQNEGVITLQNNDIIAVWSLPDNTRTVITGKVVTGWVGIGYNLSVKVNADATIMATNPDTGQIWYPFIGTRPITAIAVSQDSQELAILDSDTNLYITTLDGKNPRPQVFFNNVTLVRDTTIGWVFVANGVLQNGKRTFSSEGAAIEEFSLQGEYLAYQYSETDGPVVNVYVVTESGLEGGVQLKNTSLPTLSQDGRYLAVVDKDQNVILHYSDSLRSDGVLLTDDFTQVEAISWGPKMNQIAVLGLKGQSPLLQVLDIDRFDVEGVMDLNPCFPY